MASIDELCGEALFDLLEAGTMFRLGWGGHHSAGIGGVRACTAEAISAWSSPLTLLVSNHCRSLALAQKRCVSMARVAHLLSAILFYLFYLNTGSHIRESAFWKGKKRLWRAAKLL